MSNAAVGDVGASDRVLAGIPDGYFVKPTDFGIWLYFLLGL